MESESTPVRQARLAAGMSIKDAAEVVGVSSPTYIKKENQPGLFTIDEFFTLYDQMPHFSANRMWDCLNDRRN